MGEAPLEKRLAKILNKKTVSNKDIEIIEQEYTKLLCPKGKEICEPCYCIYQIADVCPFLEKWRGLMVKYNYHP